MTGDRLPCCSLILSCVVVVGGCSDDDASGGGGAGGEPSSGATTSGVSSGDGKTSSGTHAQSGGGGASTSSSGGGGGGGGGGPIGCVYLVDGESGDDALDGGSWITAKATITAALDAAEAENDPGGCQVWVRAGTYLPTTFDGDRATSFELRPSVGLYGGFAGTEDTLEERDVLLNETFLSGDIGIPTEDDDNSYHVVRGADAARLDGFRIRGGRANGTTGDEIHGGGLYHLAGDLVVANCRFEMNSTGDGSTDPVGSVGQWGGHGGAIYQSGGSITIEASQFASNWTGNGGPDTQIGGDGGPGGAIAVQGGSLTVDGSSFVGNSTGNGADSQLTSGGIGGGGGLGGAIAVLSSASLTVTNSTFTQNTTGDGGACQATNAGIGGTGGLGGAIAFLSSGTLSISSSDFFDNATGNGGPSAGGLGGQGGPGGAVSLGGTGPVVTIRGSSFTSNLTGNGADGVTIEGHGGTGGALFASVQSGSVTVADSLFELNNVGIGFPGPATGGGVGGAIHHVPGGSTDLVIASTTFLGNTAESGGALFFQTASAIAGADIHIVNAVFQDNETTNEAGAITYHGNGVSVFSITNATFEGNATGNVGGGIVYRASANGGPGLLSLRNSIFWNNTASQSPQIWYSDVPIFTESVLTVDDNLIQGGCDASSPLIVCGANIDADPLFEDVLGDLTLTPGSPAQNQGDSAALPADLADLDGDADVTEPTPLDRLGAARVSGASVDLGAYEVMR